MGLDGLGWAVKTHYGINIDAVSPLHGGYIHQVWKAKAQARQFALKHYRGFGWRPAVVSQTLEIQMFACRTGHPVPCVHPTVDGAWLAPFMDGGLVLMDLMPGSARAEGHLDKPTAHASGVALARLHKTLATRKCEGTPFVPDTQQLREASLNVRRTFSQESIPPAVRAMAEEAVSLRLDILQRRKDQVRPQLVAGCSYQLVHGDYYPGNLLFSETGEVTGIVDWDFAGPNWREAEIARAYLESALAGEDQLAPDRAVAFLHGYMSVQPMSAERRGAMLHLYLARLLSSLFPFTTAGDGVSALLADWQGLARRRHRMLHLLDQHLDALVAWAQAAC